MDHLPVMTRPAVSSYVAEVPSIAGFSWKGDDLKFARGWSLVDDIVAYLLAPDRIIIK